MQKQKLVATLRRVQDRVEREEAARREFEARVAATEALRAEKEAETNQLIKTTAVMMQHLKTLKAEQDFVHGRLDNAALQYS